MRAIWRAPLTGWAAAAWAGGWWAAAAGCTLATWPAFAASPFLLFFPVSGIVAARSGPAYGIATALVALAVAFNRVGDGRTLIIPTIAMVAACAVISFLAHSARSVARFALTQEAAARREHAKLLVTERALRAEAEQANRTKEEFLATLSHELRAPLNAILGWAGILLSGAPSREEVAEAAAVIQRNAQAQARLVDDLLDLDRMLAGKLRLDLQPVDIADVVALATAAVQPLVAAKSLVLTTTINPRAGVLNGDPVRLQQVLLNLLSNAVKFTPPGGNISVAVARTESHLELSVADSGAGIPPDRMPQLFEKFRPAAGINGRLKPGLGLGLAISRRLVEMHGGTIVARSAGVGLGSTFRVLLPIAAGSSARVTAERGSPAPERPRSSRWEIPAFAGTELLLVDDDPDCRALLAGLLATSGAAVRSAASGKEALDLATHRLPAILISDIGMPGMDGFELMRQLRQRPGGDHLLGIAVTAYARAEDRRNALLSGYDFFVAKPIDPGEFSAVLRRCLARLSP